MIKVRAFSHSRKKSSPYIEENDIVILEVKDECVCQQDFKLIYEAMSDWLSGRYESIIDEWFDIYLTKVQDGDGTEYYIEHDATKPVYPECKNKFTIQIESKYIDPVFGNEVVYSKHFDNLLSAQIFYDSALKENEQFKGVFPRLIIEKKPV
nr:hypothetical protein [uncultured Flavobacterium sp.]